LIEDVEMVLIFDADGAVLGRLASQTAKALLKGDEVIVVNADKAVITGNSQFVQQKYLAKLRIGSPQHGPYIPKRSDMIVRRTIRGMLPYKKATGLAAFRRLRVYKDKPAEVKGEVTSMKRDIHSRFITVGELSRIING